MYQKRTKIIAAMLIFMLTITHLNVIGQVLATSLENQTTQTNNENVEFDSYFTNNTVKEHSATKIIGDENYLYAAIKVKNAGYLKNAVVTADNANFEILETLSNKQVSKVEKSKIYLNQIKSGNAIEIAIPIQIPYEKEVALEQFNKENKVKLTAIYVDGNGKEKQIEKEIMVSLAWTQEKQAQLNMQVAKFIPYNVNNNKGLLLQTLVQSYLQDNTLPVKENKIEISVPTINGVQPQEIKVIANTIKATNGDETGVSFTQENYTYDNQNNKLTIIVKNEPNENQKVSWKKEAQDEFVVTYIYPETAIASEGVNVTISANSELKIYEASETNASKTFAGEVTLKDQISTLVDFNITTNVESISKGQLYANYEAQNKIETEYQETITANISLANLTDKIILEQNVDNFVVPESTKLPVAQTYYKTISINKNEFDKILGQTGTISFYVGTTEIAKINSETQANEQGKLAVNLSEANINNLKIETSKPITEGKLNFTILKAIKGEVEYTKMQMASVNALEVNVTGKAVNQETNFVEQALTKEIAFTEPTSQAELIIDNNNLSTVVTNKDVKIKAILKTDTLDCKLYQDPTLQITLPSYIENINIKNIEVLFETEGSKLTLKDNQLIPNDDGTKTIIIALEGTQTEYTLGAVSKGVNIVITSDIIVDKFTSNKQDQIKMIYTNSNVISKARIAETNEAIAPLNIVAPVGVITTSTISNYAENAESITSISGEEKTATIQILSEARNANLSMEVINNYNNTIDNISILGRTAFKGNKNIVTSEDLGTTINMPLTSNIVVNNVDASKVAVYYSEKEDATKDLSLASNAWTLTPANLENVKSYLIVLTDYTMNTADRINFNYTMQIPANLQHNESAYENYVVYFNNNLETGTIEDKQTSTKVGVTTGTGPVLETSISSNIEETKEVQTGKFIKYTVSVKNTGKEVAQNVVATVALPEHTNYIEFFEGESGLYTCDYEKENITFEIGNIEPSKVVTNSFWVIVGNLEEDRTTIKTKAVITAKDLAKNLESNEVKNSIKNAHFNISVSTTTNGIENLRKGDDFAYNIAVTPYDSNETLENTILKTTIPEGLKYKNTEIIRFNPATLEEETTNDEISYNENTRELTIKLGNVVASDNRKITINSEVQQLKENEYSKNITSVAKLVANGVEEETSNAIIDRIVKSAIKVSQTSTIPEGNKISADEKFSYKILIENIGADEIGNLLIEDKLPAEVQYINTEYTISGETKITSNVDENNVTTLGVNIPTGEKAEIKINVVAKAISEQKEISNSAKISSDTTGEFTTNTIKHTIEAFNYENKEDINSVTRKISGQVWKDSNNDGIKNDEEEKMSDIEVMLFNNSTGKLVTNSNGEVIKQITQKDGTYSFTNIQKGKYTVIFLYDTANYSATVYRKENVDVSKNSDAVDSNITLDGITRTAAITEEVNTLEGNIYNLDLGLISNPKFDLKLDKTISKITVQDNEGTKTYEYKDSKLAKKDLVGKQIENTTIIVEYKIKVTNEGAISGFVKKIADYMPAEMKFNSELNKDWYTSENGTLYNSSLANTIINPGESKVVTLTLTKKMTENNLGIYHNEAEIYEAYNDLGIADMDSKPGNKVANEDDISSADVVITVKTGETILFIGLSISIITTIGIGAYFIKRKVLR